MMLGNNTSFSSRFFGFSFEEKVRLRWGKRKGVSTKSVWECNQGVEEVHKKIRCLEGGVEERIICEDVCNHAANSGIFGGIREEFNEWMKFLFHCCSNSHWALIVFLRSLQMVLIYWRLVDVLNRETRRKRWRYQVPIIGKLVGVCHLWYHFKNLVSEHELRVSDQPSEERYRGRISEQRIGQGRKPWPHACQFDSLVRLEHPNITFIELELGWVHQAFQQAAHIYSKDVHL